MLNPLNLIPPQFKLIALLMWSVTCFGAGWKVEGWRESDSKLSAIGVAIDDHTTLERAANEKSTALENELERIRASNEELGSLLDKEISAKPDYSKCIVPITGIAIINKYSAQ